MYILRTVVNDRHGEFISDNWHICERIEELFDKVERINPEEYQCFDVDDITNEVFLEVEDRKLNKDKERRRKQYERLKLEFDGKAR